LHGVVLPNFCSESSTLFDLYRRLGRDYEEESVLRTRTADRESSELGGDVGGEPRKVGRRMVFPREMAEPAKWSSR
jgi:hypothetical protein